MGVGIRCVARSSLCSSIAFGVWRGLLFTVLAVSELELVGVSRARFPIYVASSAGWLSLVALEAMITVSTVPSQFLLVLPERCSGPLA